VLVKDYISPEARSRSLTAAMRSQKTTSISRREELKRLFQTEHPSASKERATAAVFYHLQEDSRLNHSEVKDESPYRPNIAKTLRRRMTVDSQHTGVWTEVQGEMAWSCCLASKQDAQGCQRVRRDLDRWILQGCDS